MGKLVKVAKTSELTPGTGKVVMANGNMIALFNIDGSFYAIDNTCLHRGGPLGEGLLEGDTVTCPWHGWRFNIKTGAHTFNPQIKVKSYPVQVEGDDIAINLE